MSDGSAASRDAYAGLFDMPNEAVAITSDDCYTPRWVFDAMGLHFDLDVAAPVGGPWHVPCDRYYTAVDDGLAQPWDGLVWCNPPYSNFTPWVRRWSTAPTAVLMGPWRRNKWNPLVTAHADAVCFLCFIEFPRPNGTGMVGLREHIFIAFRGVGNGPAERLAAADKYGAVLYGSSGIREGAA